MKRSVTETESFTVYTFEVVIKAELPKHDLHALTRMTIVRRPVEVRPTANENDPWPTETHTSSVVIDAMDLNESCDYLDTGVAFSTVVELLYDLEDSDDMPNSLLRSIDPTMDDDAIQALMIDLMTNHPRY